MRVSPVTSTSDSTTVTIASAQFASTMGLYETWLFLSNTDAWLAQGADPQTAAAADGNMFVPGGTPLLIDGMRGAKLAVIRDTADGTASLTRCGVY